MDDLSPHTGSASCCAARRLMLLSAHGGLRPDRQVHRALAWWRGWRRARQLRDVPGGIDLLDLPSPDPAGATHAHNDYVFERAVRRNGADGQESLGRIDLYRRGCFVLEAKQSRWKDQSKEVALPKGIASTAGSADPEILGRRSATRNWDVLMRHAREQAEQYARALDPAHGWPPFIILCDVGHCLELFADFSGQGKNYRQFPDRAGFRIYLDDLRDGAVRAMLRAIWLDPLSLDPARRAAAVTRDIARRLATVSQALEARGHAADQVAHFLMRCLFTMFSEDVGLLESGCFTQILEDAAANPASFAPMLEDLWRAMDKGERRQLGANYTPRAYVEQLVVATIIAPLRAQWREVVLGTVERERAANPAAAIRAVRDFHALLADTRVLDPACGTGNFLYVALELMKQLESEVLDTLTALGGQEALALDRMSVDPRNSWG